MRKHKRIGILGGTFNPLHKGHTDMGCRVLKHFNLDSVRYVLSANPPHKTNDNVISTKLRWEMLKCGLEKFPKLIPDDIEIRRDNYSWTIDTIKQLIHILPDEKLFFISGSEGFLKIKTWKRYKELLEMVNFIVVMRNHEQEKEVTLLLKSEGITPLPTGETDSDEPSFFYFSYESEFIGLSSTLIRERIGKGMSIDGFVDKKIKEIIEENNLYGKI